MSEQEDIQIEKQRNELEHIKAMQENKDKKEDQIRKMAWFALCGMLVYPVGIIISEGFDLGNASKLLADIAPTYFMAISALVATFFGVEGYKSK